MRGLDPLLLWGALPAQLFTPFTRHHTDSHLSRGASWVSLLGGALLSSLPVVHIDGGPVTEVSFGVFGLRVRLLCLLVLILR